MVADFFCAEMLDRKLSLLKVFVIYILAIYYREFSHEWIIVKALERRKESDYVSTQKYKVTEDVQVFLIMQVKSHGIIFRFKVLVRQGMKHHIIFYNNVQM